MSAPHVDSASGPSRGRVDVRLSPTTAAQIRTIPFVRTLNALFLALGLLHLLLGYVDAGFVRSFGIISALLYLLARRLFRLWLRTGQTDTSSVSRDTCSAKSRGPAARGHEPGLLIAENELALAVREVVPTGEPEIFSDVPYFPTSSILGVILAPSVAPPWTIDRWLLDTPLEGKRVELVLCLSAAWLIATALVWLCVPRVRRKEYLRVVPGAIHVLRTEGKRDQLTCVKTIGLAGRTLVCDSGAKKLIIIDPDRAEQPDTVDLLKIDDPLRFVSIAYHYSGSAGTPASLPDDALVG